MLSEYIDTLAEKGIKLSFDEKAQEFLADKACGGKSGARDLRNTIRREVEDKIASAIISNREGAITAIALSADDNGITIDIL